MGERTRMGERDVQHLEHRGHLGLAGLAAPPLGDVEDQIDRVSQPTQGLERILVGLDVDAGVTVRLDRLVDRGDRRRLVELGLGLRDLVQPRGLVPDVVDEGDAHRRNLCRVASTVYPRGSRGHRFGCSTGATANRD